MIIGLRLQLRFLATSEAKGIFLNACLKTKVSNSVSFFPRVSSLVQCDTKSSPSTLLIGNCDSVVDLSKNTAKQNQPMNHINIEIYQNKRKRKICFEFCKAHNECVHSVTFSAVLSDNPPTCTRTKGLNKENLCWSWELNCRTSSTPTEAECRRGKQLD